MLPKTHIILGALASLLIYLIYPAIGPINTLIIFLSSFLIDVDHYIYYILKKKDYNLKKAFNWFVNQRKIFLKLSPKKRENFERTIIIFHGIECWLLIILLIFVHKIFLFILMGIMIHMFFDFIDLHLTKTPFHIKTSQVYVHIKNKNNKNLIKI